MSVAEPAFLFRRRKPTNVHELAEELRKAVAGGVFKDGDRLPTIKQIAGDTGLAYNVVNRAFAVLQAEGLLVSRKRAGTFVASKVEQGGESRTPVRIFALISPELSTGFYPLLQKGFDLAAGQHGYQIITSSTENDVRVQADTILQLMDKSVAGVALVPATLGPSPAHHIRQLQQRNIPVVMLHRQVQGVRAPLIKIPAEEVGRLAGREIARCGHRRVAYCVSHRDGNWAEYENGFREALAEGGAMLKDEHIDYGEVVLFDSQHYAEYEERIYRWFGRVMSQRNRPTALFARYEPIAEIAYMVAMRHGLRVPEDLSIVSVGGKERRGAIVRRLACVTFNEQEVGRLTADLLDQMNTGQRKITDEEMFPIEIDFDAGVSLASPSGRSRN